MRKTWQKYDQNLDGYFYHRPVWGSILINSQHTGAFKPARHALMGQETEHLFGKKEVVSITATRIKARVV
ncbi:hypothetical protein [Pontibacter liquoris]|uniref:hypothetical protein n=1 Tax=Pontibacter liquoris TaxID=2905677 RepID=UPI001FA75DB7|nr:hypothetical protein [Pontibacter liquoris]